MTRLGILQTDAVRADLLGHFGDYPAMFTDLLQQVDPRIEPVIYDVQVGSYPTDIDEVDAYLITGSKRSVYEDEAWIRRLSRFVIELNGRRKKLVGICFGHQMVAHALGGRTEASENGWGVGMHQTFLTEEGRQMTGAEKGFNWIVSHRDQVVVPAPGSVVLAGSDFCPIGMCVVDQHIFTVQGHPEFTKPYLRALIADRRSLLGATVYERALQSLEQREADAALMAEWIVSFIKR